MCVCIYIVPFSVYLCNVQEEEIPVNDVFGVPFHMGTHLVVSTVSIYKTQSFIFQYE
jgi:hypothetical protein